MQIRHPWRWAVTFLALIVIVFVAYAGWLLWDTSRQLSAVSEDAQSAKSALLAGDSGATADALDDFSRRASTAADRTDSPVWSVLIHLPWIGDDAKGVRTVSQVADDLSDNGLHQLATAVGTLNEVLPQDGGVNVTGVQSLRKPVRDGLAALVKAQGNLAHEDPSGYVESLKVRYRDLQSTIDSATNAMGVADRALDILPEMLGANGARNYLLVLQNNAEIRATGGLPGSVSLLHVDDGQITLTKQLAGNSFGEAPTSVLPLTVEESKLYGSKLGRYFLDANFTPDFPRSAALWRARWQDVEGDPIDGVVSLDTVTLSYILRALGPVVVDGVTLTSDNVVSELLSNVYKRLPNPLDQDAFFRDVASAIFAQVTSFSGSKQQLLTAVRQSVDEHRLYIHDFHADVQHRLQNTVIAGDLTKSAPTSPQVGVYLNDGTGGKMSYYLRYDVSVRATSCLRNVQTLKGTLRLSSTAPQDSKTSLPQYVTGTSLPRSSAGFQLVAVDIFGPVAGTVEKLDDDELDFDQATQDFRSRQVRSLYFILRPGETKFVRWNMTSGEGQVGETTTSVTASIAGGDSSTRAPSAC